MWIRFQSPAKASLMTSLVKDYTHARGKMLVCKLVDSSTHYVQECEFSARHVDEDCKANIVIEQHSRKTKPPRDNDLSRINTRFAKLFWRDDK